jgi:hypothetical protein
MSKKNTRNGGLKSIRGGKGGGGYGISNGNGAHGNGHDPDETAAASGGRNGAGGGHEDHGDEDESFPNGNRVAPGPEKVIDLGSRRAQRNLDNRRAFERFFLDHLVEVVCEFDNGKEQVPLEVLEVSETGCSFRLPVEKSQLLPRDTTGAIVPIQLRLYFSRDSYLRVGFHVINATRDIGGGRNSLRFGCRVDETFASAEAYRQFVRFMEQFVRHAVRDTKQVSGY